jgi:hypothetical protein
LTTESFNFTALSGEIRTWVKGHCFFLNLTEKAVDFPQWHNKVGGNLQGLNQKGLGCGFQDKLPKNL